MHGECVLLFYCFRFIFLILRQSGNIAIYSLCAIVICWRNCYCICGPADNEMQTIANLLMRQMRYDRNTMRMQLRFRGISIVICFVWHMVYGRHFHCCKSHTICLCRFIQFIARWTQTVCTSMPNRIFRFSYNCEWTAYMRRAMHWANCLLVRTCCCWYNKLWTMRQ